MESKEFGLVCRVGKLARLLLKNTTIFKPACPPTQKKSENMTVRSIVIKRDKN